jgi:hypothetical protein
MSEIVYRISEVLSSVVKGVPVGTNLGLVYLMWMLMSGQMLKSRGAVIPGLANMGMPAVEVRRTWAATSRTETGPRPTAQGDRSSWQT